MRQRVYYEAFGETKKILLKMLDDRVKVKNKMHAWAKAHGADAKRIGINDDGFGFRWSLIFKTEPPDPKNWKKHKGGGPFWNPKFSTAEGKKYADEMKALANEIPSVSKMMDVIKLPSIGDGLYVNSMGLCPKGKRLLIVVPTDKYKPPKGINLKRISDTLFEKLAGKKDAQEETDE